MSQQPSAGRPSRALAGLHERSGGLALLVAAAAFAAVTAILARLVLL